MLLLRRTGLGTRPLAGHCTGYRAVTDPGDDPRGAGSPAESDRQHAKIVAAIIALDAEVVGLMDIENDADGTAVDTLVAGVNADAPPCQQ